MTISSDDLPAVCCNGLLDAHGWAAETMSIINKLTPEIKNKSFDPDWFLLRERLESAERRMASNDKVRNPHPDKTL